MEVHFMEIGERLKWLRENNDKNQTEISKVLQTTQQYYGQYELGNRTVPTRVVIALSNYYNVSADYILGIDKGKDYPKANW